MGKRGPKPKPTALMVFDGDPGRRLPQRQGEATPPPADDLSPPEWLGEVGQKVWRELAPILHAIGCFAETDRQLFGLYCEAWDEFHAARGQIALSGVIAVSGEGAEYQHPAVGIKNKAVQRIKQIGGEFGLSPASRVGLNTGPKDSGDQLDEFKRHG